MANCTNFWGKKCANCTKYQTLVLGDRPRPAEKKERGEKSPLKQSDNQPKTLLHR
jgi:hypothetical protein